ncbi:MAG: DUF4271 domain-containing protein [Chitinophagaceae bacterium]
MSTGILSAQQNTDSTFVQVTDTAIQKDSTITKDTLNLPIVSDDVSKMPPIDSGWTVNPSDIFFQQKLSWQLLQRHPYFGFSATPEFFRSEIRQSSGKEVLFYLFVFLLIVFAIIRRVFPKYFNDLFRLLFRTTLKQRQLREQLLESPLPSLLWNVFFIISGGLYTTFIIQHFELNTIDNFWLMFLLSSLALSGIYLIKFLGLKISGWLFNVSEPANAYIFIVFIINKMIGILLLPFIILAAFTSGGVYFISLNLSWYLIAGLFFYRIILTFRAVHNQINVNPFHFFLYICAFEIAPLLLIYKGLLLFFQITA